MGRTVTSDLPDAPQSTPDPSKEALLASFPLFQEKPLYLGEPDYVRPSILLALPIQQPHCSWQLAGEGSGSLFNPNPLIFSAGAGVHHPHRSKGGCQDGVTWTVLETHPNVTAIATGFPLSPSPSAREN